jgi:hypothetical protein
MSRRIRTSRGLETIAPTRLAGVVGGRITPSTTLDPVLLQGISELAQAIVSVGQNLAAAKQASSQQMMQLVQQMMGARGGGGGGGGAGEMA